MSRKNFEGNDWQLHEKLEKIIQERIENDPDLSEPVFKHCPASFSHDEDITLENFTSFFLWFYLLLRRLPKEQNRVRQFTDFPNVARIVPLVPMSDEEIVSETIEAARETFGYFDIKAEEGFTNHMYLFLDESRTRTVFNRAGKHYGVEATESVVFSHKSLMINQMMKLRAEVSDERGRKTFWTPELKKDFFLFYKSVIKVVKDAKKFMKTHKNSRNPYGHLKIEYPQIPLEILPLFFTGRKSSEPAEIAAIWAMHHFNIDQKTSTIRRKVLPLAEDELGESNKEEES